MLPRKAKGEIDPFNVKERRHNNENNEILDYLNSCMRQSKSTR